MSTSSGRPQSAKGKIRPSIDKEEEISRINAREKEKVRKPAHQDDDDLLVLLCSFA